jgi:hypothetical protein
MRKVKVTARRQAYIVETHFFDVPTDQEGDVEAYVLDVLYLESPTPFAVEVDGYEDDEPEMVRIIEVVES